MKYSEQEKRWFLIDYGGFSPEELQAELDARKLTLDEMFELCGGGKPLPLEGEALPEEALPSPDPDGWPEVVPFEDAPLPEFPVEQLPWPLDALAENCGGCYQVDPAMPGVLLLGVLAALFQGKAVMHVKPGFTTELSLYCVCVADPGERKTPVFRCLTDPVAKLERLRQAQEAPEIRRNQQQRKVLEGRQKELETQLMKAPKGVDLDAVRNALEEVNQELDNFVDEYGFRVLADDTTPERLIDLLDKHSGMLVASDEPGLFVAMKGRYDPNANIDVFLKGIDASPIRVDRIGRPSNLVASPHLSMALGAQRSAIRDFVKNPVFAGRGLVARFLYADCRSVAGRRRWDVAPIPTAISMGYEQLIQAAMDFAPAEPVVLRFTEEAQLEAERFGNEAEAALLEGGALDFDLAWGNKFPAAVFKLAALFQLVECMVNDLPPETVDVDWLEAAEKIGWCLAEHARSIFTEAGADPVVADAQYIWKRLRANGAPEISVRDLKRKCKRFQKTEEMFAPLAMLEERGYIQRARVDTGGRPSENVRVNPTVL